MYRLLQRQEVLYGHYAEAVQLVDEVNELLRARGLAEFTPWAPTVGKGNELVLMSEYPDLAAFQRARTVSPNRSCGLQVDRAPPRVRFAFPRDGASRSGDLRFRARIKADGLTEPVIKEQSTKVYGDDPTAHK